MVNVVKTTDLVLWSMKFDGCENDRLFGCGHWTKNDGLSGCGQNGGNGVSSLCRKFGEHACLFCFFTFLWPNL